eukprot:m.13628 g.13628  ORF g.13628 m.13628 type:complete len:285 (+) comp9791_c0_seq2:320-1174(+)
MTTTFVKKTTKPSRGSPPKINMTKTRMELLRPYAPDFAGNIRHDHILTVGSRVEAKLKAKHQQEIATAVAAALTQERTLAADRLVIRLEKEEKKTKKRIQEALALATEEHATAVGVIHQQRDETEMLAINATLDDCAQKQQQALHQASVKADHRLTRELHLKTVETTTCVTKSLTKQFEEMSAQARLEADEREQKALANQATTLRLTFDEDLATLRAQHQAQVDTLNAALNNSGSTNQTLEQKIQKLLTDLEQAQTTLANTIADYRRTLACSLPNYNEKHSFLF